jgi:hypothetical protein
MSTALINNQPTSVIVTSLSSGSVVVNSQLVYNSSTLSSASMTSIITSSVKAAAASSSSFPVIADSVTVSVSSSIPNGIYIYICYSLNIRFLIFKIFLQGTLKMKAHASYLTLILICFILVLA